MVTKDNNAGFLSKVARFVRNPTKDWSELDKTEPEPEGGYGKLALKEIIERKRQNDFVRQREFDHLRKLRRNGPAISLERVDHPSFFETSITSNHEERVTTLKKIDEIEAQMSKQWWKSRQDAATLSADSLPVAAVPPRAARDDSPGADTSTFSSTRLSLSQDFDSVQGADYEPTQMGFSPALDATARVVTAKKSSSRNFDAGITDFSISNLFSVEMSDGLTDPELEEAAIRFANGEDAGAEAALLTALQADNVAPDAADRWAGALFDLYRATGQQASFDSVAIDYAMRFGRSAPAWFSTPDLLNRKAVVLPVLPNAELAQHLPNMLWECPAELDLPAMQALQTSLSGGPSPWHLHWSGLQVITPDAAKALAALFAQWCVQPVKLQFGGADILEKTLRSFTPSGDKRVDVFWWQLRLDALRIMRQQDEFELAALDYCVVYEVSPPPWIEAVCDYSDEQLAPAMQSTVLSLLDAPPPEVSDVATVLMGVDMMPASIVELTGEVLGDAAQALDELQAGLKGADRLVISCARLIRVDFSAAGSILNWVTERETEGCQVQFRDVPRLVAVFFNVIGINEHARVLVRTN